MKLKKNALANTFGLTTVILWTICTAIVWILPGFSLTVTKWWMHGLGSAAMGDWNLTISNFLLGGLTLVGSAWGTGWLFGWSWEKVSR